MLWFAEQEGVTTVDAVRSVRLSAEGVLPPRVVVLQSPFHRVRNRLGFWLVECEMLHLASDGISSLALFSEATNGKVIDHGN